MPWNWILVLLCPLNYNNRTNNNKRRRSQSINLKLGAAHLDRVSGLRLLVTGHIQWLWSHDSKFVDRDCGWESVGGCLSSFVLHWQRMVVEIRVSCLYESPIKVIVSWNIIKRLRGNGLCLLGSSQHLLLLLLELGCKLAWVAKKR